MVRPSDRAILFLKNERCAVASSIIFYNMINKTVLKGSNLVKDPYSIPAANDDAETDRQAVVGKRFRVDRTASERRAGSGDFLQNARNNCCLFCIRRVK